MEGAVRRSGSAPFSGLGVTSYLDFPRRPLLAIDTSSAQGGIALYDGHRLSLRSWPADRSHTMTLLSEIHHLLDRDSVAVRELAAITIAIGPGTFTGLRVGFGVAKGFHLATGAPLIGVSTLEATALPFAICGMPIVAAVAAGRGRLAWAHYQPKSGRLIETQAPKNGTFDELVAEIDGGEVIVTGELDGEQTDRLTRLERAYVPTTALRARQPAALAEIGWGRWIAGQTDDAVTIEPMYLSR